MNREGRRSKFGREIRKWHMLLVLSLIASIDNTSKFSARAFSPCVSLRRTLYNSFSGSTKSIHRPSAPSASRMPLHASTYDGTGTATKVLYQKVIRPPTNLPEILFLGYLVEYLESHFEIPNGLPMIYDIHKPKQDKAQYVIAVDSPLSPASDVTRMEIEVVGVYTTGKDEEQGKNQVPNMAMVVVKKDKDPQSSIPPMMVGLFDDSEKQILKALDRGLEDFVQGKIQFQDDQVQEKKIPNFRTAEQVIDAELMDEAPPYPSESAKPAPEDVVVEAYATSDGNDDTNKMQSNPKPAERKQEKVETKPSKATEAKKATSVEAKEVAPVEAKAVDPQTEGKESSAPTATADDSNPTGLDFAVRAAKQAAAKRKARQAAGETSSEEDFAVATARQAATMKNKSSPSEDFAIAAARKAAASRKTNKPKTIKSTTAAKKVKVKTTVKGTPSPPQPQMGQPINLSEMDQSPPAISPENLKENRSFGFTISRPGDRGKRKKTTVAKVKKGSLPKKTASKTSFVKVAKGFKKKEKSSRPAQKPKAETKAQSDLPPTVSTKKEEQKKEKPTRHAQKTEAETKVQSNLPPTVSTKKEESVMNGTTVPSAESEKNEVSTDKETESKPIPSQKQMEIDVMEAAKDVIEEMVEGSEDMTPEELLRDVLKFDEEEKKKTAPGSGFVSGAFEKAKDILKEQYRHRQTKTMDGSNKPDIVDPNQFPVDADAPISEEEELKRMFQAGEQIADNRITKSVVENVDLKYGQKETTEADVDELIFNDKTISNYAKVLDDELVELELQINPTPGEELDGPRKNPVFDIMSGPEVYDPNVEMDTVNYPGALPGTKEVRLPKQLEEAKKQAEFATSVLRKVRTEETKDEDGEVTATKYFVGEREMTSQQLNDLQAVVAEASQIGIITDPVVLMQESSRLQLLVDELWNQPDERFHEIAENYKDLILSDNFVSLVKERMANMVERDLDALRRDDESLKEDHERERQILGKVVEYAQLLLKEVRALGAELEAQQLEVVRSICKVAMDPRHVTEEETAMALTDAVRDMRPLLDDMFVAYLKYAVAEEKGRLARAGLLDDPEHNQWLFVLQIVQQGVYNEIAVGINRYIDHIGYVIRMKTPQQRRKLLEKLIDVMPTLDVRPFVQVVENIVGSLGDGAKGEFEGIDTLGDWTNELLQLYRDMHELLPPERIALKAKDADEWAERQRQRLLESRKISKQRLQAENENAHLQELVEAEGKKALGRRGEIERIE